MGSLANIDVRLMVSNAGVTYKQISERMGITRQRLSTIMSKPLNARDRQRILESLDRLQEVTR